MSLELYYTSLPKGLRTGSKGFCTAAITEGLAPALAEQLEALSGYRPLFPPGDPRAAKNPVAWAHWRLPWAGDTHSVLSRVAFAGFDYSGRSNKFAHHVLLDRSDMSPAGPAWVMMQPGVMAEAWSGEPRVLEGPRAIPRSEGVASTPCQQWGAAAGDPGWGGVLAEAFATNASRPAGIIYDPTTNVLALLAEAISLLPPHLRWTVTFNTHFTELPAGLACAWRCCVAGSPAANDLARSCSLIIDLTKPLGTAQGEGYVSRARGQLAAQGESRPDDDTGIAPTAHGPQYAVLRASNERNRRLAEIGPARAGASGAALVLEEDDATGEPLVGDGESAATKWTWRALAVVWPIVALAVAAAFRTPSLGPTLPAATAPAAPLGDQPRGTEIAALAERFNVVNETLQKKSKEVELLIRQRDESRSGLERALAELRQSREAEALLKDDLAKAPASAPAVAPPASQPAVAGSVQVDPGTTLGEVVDAPYPAELTKAVLLRLPGLSTLRNAEWFPPPGLAETAELRAEWNEKDGLAVVRAWRDPYEPNREKRDVLATASPTPDGLLWKWGTHYVSQAPKRTSWDRVLRYSSFALSSGDANRRLQFVRPDRRTWSLDQPACTPAINAPDKVPSILKEITVQLPDAPPGWDVRLERHTWFFESKPDGAKFEIERVDGALDLASNWGQRRAECAEAVASLQSARQNLAKILEAKSRAEIGGQTRSATEPKDDRQSASDPDAKHELEAVRDQLRRIDEPLPQLVRQRAAFSSMPPFHVAFRLPNGVVLAEVLVRVPLESK